MADLATMTVEEIDDYKANIEAQVDALREQLHEANFHRRRAVAMDAAQAALRSAGVAGDVVISPGPATIGAQPGEVN